MPAEAFASAKQSRSYCSCEIRVCELASCRLSISKTSIWKTSGQLIKTKKSRGLRPIRGVFWYDECNDAIKEWIAERERFLKKRGVSGSALFVATSRDNGVGRIGPSAINIAFRKASWVAGVPTLNPHSLRHRKGHLLAKSGANNSIISGVLGHSSLASSYIYTMMNDKELEDVARKYGGER